MHKGHVLPMQRMIAGSNPNSWNINNSNMMMRPPTNNNPQQNSPNYYNFAPPAGSMIFPHYIPSSSSSSSSSSCYENQDQLPESLSQLLLGGVVGEEDKSCLSHIQAKKLENWEEQLLLQHHAPNSHEYQAVTMPRWSQVVPVASPQNSSSATITSNLNPNILDFSDNKADGKRLSPPGRFPECNSKATGGALKKARVQTSSTPSTFKVRKEKLGDRITALHQIVSPFGKTDTASVLLEAIGYIRFLHNQVEALSIPYLGIGAVEMRQQQSLLNDNSTKAKEGPGQEPHKEPKKDLRSRGLCLVPISCTLQVGSDNGADYWTPALGGGFC